MPTFIEQELEYHEDPRETHFQRKTTPRSIFCSKLSKGILVCLVFAVVVPTIAYYFAISRSANADEEEQHYSCLVQTEYRIPCGPVGVTAAECEKISCCYNRTTEQCHHYLPSKYFYQKQGDGYVPSQKMSPYGYKTLGNIQLTITERNENKISLVVHEPSESTEQATSSKTIENKNYIIDQSNKKLILEILDKDKDTVLSTASAALIASENYWEWSFLLSNETIFGLDRNIIKLNGNETLTKVIYKNKNDHSTLPVFWAYKNKKFYGCVVKHDGPLEVTVLASNIIILKSLVGKRIELELTLGPTPSDLYRRQYEEIIVPPLWGLGSHNCRKGDSINLKRILKTYSDNNGSTFATDCIHENLFLALQQSNNTDDDLSTVRTVLVDLVTSGTKFMLSLPPHILANETNSLYTAAQQLDILYKYQSKIYLGQYLGQEVAYPDYSHPFVAQFVQKLLDWITETIGLGNISGFVLNANWPEDDSYRDVNSSVFPYFSTDLNDSLRYTLPWNLKTYDNHSHLEKHNYYGALQYESIYFYLNSSSNFTDLFIVSATKNYGDIEPEISDNFNTSWDNFQMYLSKMLFNSISGNFMVGLPICGDTNTFNKTSQETLCIRWYLAAATMPYFRVSSGDPFRDPSNLNTKFATKAANLAIDRRNSFAEYFYTILSRSEPLVRPMYYDYHADREAFNLERQYTIGKDIIVAHPLSSGRAKLQVFLPHERRVWYEFWGGKMYTSLEKNKYYVEIDTLETDWISFIAQGSIVSFTTSNTIDLIIALDCSKDNCHAKGELFKDNSYLALSATKTSVTINNLPPGCDYTVGYIKVYYYQDKVDYQSRYTKNTGLCADGNNATSVQYEEAISTAAPS